MGQSAGLLIPFARSALHPRTIGLTEVHVASRGSGPLEIKVSGLGEQDIQLLVRLTNKDAGSILC